MVSPRRQRRVPLAMAMVAVALSGWLAGCSGERAAPVPTRPTPPPTITTLAPGPSAPVGTSPDATRPEPASTTTAATTTTSSTIPPPPPTAEQWARFDDILDRELIGRGDYSASFAVRRDGRMLHRAAYGVRVPLLPPPIPSTIPGATAEPTAGSTTTTTTAAMGLAPAVEPAEPDDRFRVASISKVVTATVVMQLVEAGEVGLDDPVGARLGSALGVGDVPPDVAAVTVRQLLSHTSGFGTYRSTFFGGQVDSCEEAGRNGLARGLQNPPGTAYHYSNMNYCLLGLLVEVVTGEPYETVAERRLLGPLGIQGMRMAGTFDPNPGEVEHPSTPGRNYMEALGGAGAWVATAADVVTIADALEGSRPVWHPLSADSMAIMRVPAPTAAPPPAIRTSWYGLGQIVFADGSWGHTGTIENTHAMFLVRPDGVTWALLVSGDHPGETDDLRRIVDDALAEAGIRF